jgi:hypothetical protein
LLLLYQIPDGHGVQTVQWNISVVALVDVKKIRCLTRAVGGGAIHLAWTSVSDALALKNGNSFQIKVLDSGS